MKVLVATNMYPGRDPGMDYKGIFVKEQVDGLRLSGCAVDVHVIDGHKGLLLGYCLGSIVLLFKALFGKYDLIHCHYGLSAMFTLLLPFKRWNNIVLTLHGGDILIKQGKINQVAITKKILKKVGFVITLNSEMNEIVAKYTDRYQTLVCGADGQLFNGNYSCKQVTTILFPGSPDREVKNYPFFEQIVNSYKKIGKEVSVIILDGFTRKEMASAFQNGSLLLMTSHSEGSPQVIKEAMLSDLPILSSDVGDVSSVIGSAPGTLVFKDISPESIAGKIDDLLVEASLSSGSRRERIFEIELEQNCVIDKLLKIYSGVIGVN